MTYDSANWSAWAVELPKPATVAMGHLRADWCEGSVGTESLEACPGGRSRESALRRSRAATPDSTRGIRAILDGVPCGTVGSAGPPVRAWGTDWEAPT
ncbi:hypothetical protein Nm8I071_61500 [Nonomuraea sp. TT08I-71]|nr:hypothetical protein Nm8I071_61500 [Nonomuraea sp. TT08I-71]